MISKLIILGLGLTGSAAQHGDESALVQSRIHVTHQEEAFFDGGQLSVSDMSKLAEAITFDTDPHKVDPNAVKAKESADEAETKELFSKDAVQALLTLSMLGLEKMDKGLKRSQELGRQMTIDSKTAADNLKAALPTSDAKDSVLEFERKLQEFVKTSDAGWSAYMKNYKASGADIMEYYEKGPGKKVIGGTVFASALCSPKVVSQVDAFWTPPLSEAVQLASTTTGSLSATKEKLQKINLLLQGGINRMEPVIHKYTAQNESQSDIEELINGPLSALMPSAMKMGMRSVNHRNRDVMANFHEFGSTISSSVQEAADKMAAVGEETKVEDKEVVAQPQATKAVAESCGQFDETLKSYDGTYLGSSLKLGLEDAEQKVSWETASQHVITAQYTHKSSDYAKDDVQPSNKFGYSYGLEPSGTLHNGFETVEVGGCSVKSARVSEMEKGQLLADGATIVGGLRPVPGETSHKLLGERAPRVSFCFPTNKSMDGRLVWGAPDPRKDAKAVTLNIPGGMAAHHWAVNVTGMSMQGTNASGFWFSSILDEHREKVANDPKAYWMAVFSTGQSTLVVPQEVLDAMKTYLDPFNHVDCTNTSHLPTLTFGLDGHDYMVSPKDYLVELDAEGKDIQALQQLPLHFRPQLSASPTAAKNKCYMVFADPTPFDGVFVLGQPFLRRHKTTYDYEKRQIITVPHEGSCESGATRSQSSLKFMFYVLALAMSFGSML